MGGGRDRSVPAVRQFFSGPSAPRGADRSARSPFVGAGSAAPRGGPPAPVPGVRVAGSAAPYFFSGSVPFFNWSNSRRSWSSRILMSFSSESETARGRTILGVMKIRRCSLLTSSTRCLKR